jgi:hypothetical protein
MSENPSDPEAARRLEIFLDRVSCTATTQGPASDPYLLHPDYKDLFIEDHSKIRLREMLCTLVHLLDTEDPVCKNSAWNHVED